MSPAFIASLPSKLSFNNLNTKHALRPSSLLPPQSRRTRMTIITPQAARTAIAVYGVAISAGGIGAFLRSSSKPSLISGIASGIVLGLAYAKDSVPIALATAIALTLVFSIRLIKTKKFVPAGALALVSLLATALFAVAIYA